MATYTLECSIPARAALYPLSPEDSIPELIGAIRRTIEYWLAVHTDPEEWAYSWVGADGYHSQITGDGHIGNYYFDFDLRYACIKAYAEDHLDDYWQCCKCGELYEKGLVCENEEWHFDGGEGEESAEVNIYALIDHLEERWMTFCDLELEAELIHDVMVSEGFEAYRQGVEPVTCDIEDECIEMLAQFAKAETNLDLLTVAMQASGILHIHGSICRDYGRTWGLTPELVDQYRSGGLVALFDQEEIDQFVLEDQEV